MSRPPDRTIAETELGPPRPRSAANPARSDFEDSLGGRRDLVKIMDLLLTAVCHFVDGAAGVDEEVLALIVKRYRRALEVADFLEES